MDIDACLAVEAELDRVISKFTNIRKKALTEINDALARFQEIQCVLKGIENVDTTIGTTSTASTQVNAIDNIDDPMADEGSIDMIETIEIDSDVESGENAGIVSDTEVITEEQIGIINDALEKVNERLQRISGEHRELHSAVSKVGKVIDRNFISDFMATTRTDVLQTEENMLLLNKIIAKHYVRQGMEDVAELLIKESHMPVDMAQDVYDSESSFAEIYRIWKGIQNHELEPALEWAERFSDDLIEKNSILEFKLHRLAFLQIVSRGISAQSEAINYARKNFHKFVDRFENEIPVLMGCFIYLPVGIENSPYKSLISPEMWTEASYVFMKDACLTLGISKNSLLSVVINAGCTALPALLNIKQVMQSRQVLNIWSGRDELPIEIDLDPEYRYHSIFACPILRQQTSDENPPKKLICGHVISKDALQKLSNGLLLKCPYCPMEQNADEAVRIYF